MKAKSKEIIRNIQNLGQLKTAIDSIDSVLTVENGFKFEDGSILEIDGYTLTAYSDDSKLESDRVTKFV